ncbi:hypothetical protein [Cryptosporangium sp. NPDC048952]|uniref:hypothetical protein n=1 Tax=Cryptosporangium sp. NPDC048952 TaxID=3363961 RepID=UPI0037214614
MWRGVLPRQTVGDILGHLQQRAASAGRATDGFLDIAAEEGRDGSGRLVVRWSAIDALELLDESTAA